MASNGNPAALARRLRQLRVDRSLTQQDLADVFGVGLSSVSSWESVRAPKLPTRQRLLDYARFFSTDRPATAERRLARDEELTEQERATRDRLTTELQQLRSAATGGAAGTGVRRGLWHFPDGGPVRLICRSLEAPTKFARSRDHNYMQLAAYADIDALVELFGHVRAQNPDSDVQFDLSNRLESDDLGAHLVLFGSWAAADTAVDRLAGTVHLPVRQLEDEEVADGETFEFVSEPGRRIRPRFVGNDPTRPVAEDVGLFVRTPNPSNVSRTLTICSGVFSRGVYGAVRLLTDSKLREQNEARLAELFGDATTFGLLMRVPVFDHATSTPDLRNPLSIIHSWSGET